ncbi:MAG TPA: EamA family transporter [Steroidobacteraceae bacterium]|nr:EamA family transporter [Steroidobacteraceae bacterium]
MRQEDTAHSGALSPLILACLAATWFIWGSTYLAIKFALVSFPPFFQMGTRFLVAGTVLLVWARWRGQKMPTLAQWRNALIVGALMLGGSMGGAAYAEQTVASGLVVAFIAITPAVITIASLPFGIRPSRLEVLGICIGMIGVFVLIRGAGFASSPAGLIAMTIATIGWSTGSVLSQNVFRLAPSSAGFASQMLCGGIFLLGLSLLARESFHWPPQPLASAAWIYLVVFGSLLAFSAYMILLSSTSTTLASSYCFVNPVIGMLLGMWLGGETTTSREWIAVAIIVVGVTVVVTSRGARPKAPK